MYDNMQVAETKTKTPSFPWYARITLTTAGTSAMPFSRKNFQFTLSLILRNPIFLRLQSYIIYSINQF